MATTSNRSGRRAAAAALGVALALAGCGGDSSGSNGGSDGGGSASDAGGAVCTGDNPDDSGCNGPCERGNSFGVGRYCTPGGGECADTQATFCTVDFNPTDLAFCTRPCSDSSQCGEDATCRGDDGGGPMGCVPNFCLTPGELDAAPPAPDAGADAGPGPDAGPDAGADAGPDPDAGAPDAG
jgi:hypothetical protein